MAATQPPLTPSPQQLWARLRPDWLTGYGVGEAFPEENRDSQINQQWIANVNHRRHQLQQHESDRHQPQKRPLLLIAEPDPLNFLASFWAALLSDWDIALANSDWGGREWHSALQILQPTLTWPPPNPRSLSVVVDASPARRVGQTQPIITTRGLSVVEGQTQPSILIPTGGTTGTLKFAQHTWATLYAAAISFCQTFPTPIHTYCVLPVYHVSGLMQILRAWFSQAQVIITPFKTLETSPPLISSPANWYISLVPTQLTRLIAAHKGPWLSQFQAVLLGGAPPWPTLLTQATHQNIPLCLSYGMTETAAMVTVQTPGTQNHSSGTPLPHVKITIEAAGLPQPADTVGQIVIQAPTVALGYCGVNSTAFSAQKFRTDDLGYLTAQGQLYVTGRTSSKIISGGENIFPAEVEAALRSTDQVKDVHVFSQPDPQWGEAVTAAFVPAHPKVTSRSLQAALSAGNAAPLLSRYKHPKHWIALSHIPRNAQGKLLKSALTTQIAQLSNSSNNPAADSDADCPS
ncbi:MAG: 2-succinylbenzoate-CoA ligase [Leptolyngbya foveolarum]|uniref:2-succinylbenzoate-CoA ligase n=1 Tax=Leptolyngbya foveolarum TaxID=47253 RepID=A0A2W4UP17_9CYAN|nr:MAG: 2-succinylbenzoate-CoA ligase [Leptolyngbya foveolarum]